MTVFIHREQIEEEKRRNAPTLRRWAIVKALVDARVPIGIASGIAALVVSIFYTT